MGIPYKILHIKLNEGVPTLPHAPGCEVLYVVFWWHDIPLGHREISSAQLPMQVMQVANLAVQGITLSVGDKLFPEGFKAPLSEHFDCQEQSGSLEFSSLLALERPMEKLSEVLLKLEPQSITPTVSVVVCTRDRPEQLERCLKSLQDLSHTPQEIIVVDNAPSTEETRLVVSRQPEFRYIREPRPGLSAARNTGIKKSKGSIIAFTDDDVLVHPDWVMRLKKSFQNPLVMAVTGQVLPGELETEAQLIFETGLGNFGWGYRARTFDQRFFRATKHLGVPVWRIGAGANMAFRRQVFDLVGYFDERLGAGSSGCSEDSEIWYRILAKGWICHYEPKAVVYHYHRRDLDGLRDQMYRYMRGHVTALIIQFGRYRHSGNLLRLLFSLPAHYFKLLLSGLLRGFGLRHKTYLQEMLGCLAGVKFYVQNRNAGDR